MVHQQRDIFAALAQGGNLKGNHVQAVVQIFAELTLAHALVDIAVGGRDNANVIGGRFFASQPPDLTLFQHTEQINLGLRCGLGNFVQKQRPMMCRLETPGLPPRGPGEGSFFVAKQLAFQQGVGKSAEVDRDERLLGARAESMDGLGNKFFTRATLALDQNRRVGVRHLPNLPEETLDDRRVPNDIDVFALPSSRSRSKRFSAANRWCSDALRS